MVTMTLEEKIELLEFKVATLEETIDGLIDILIEMEILEVVPDEIEEDDS